MAHSDVRLLIRQAQAAELGGERERAAALLQRAATMTSPASARTTSLLKHALRLDPSNASIQDALRLAEEAFDRSSSCLAASQEGYSSKGEQAGGRCSESVPDEARVEARSLSEAPGALPQAMGSARRSAESLPGKLAPGDNAEPDGDGWTDGPPLEIEKGSHPARARHFQVIERGPVWADSSSDCWCSFCCRPQIEAGSMIAGPAGAFICQECIARSAELAGLGPRGGVVMKCVFCAIVEGGTPAPVVYQDAHCIAFLDHRPLFPGHVLVLPRAHVETLLDLPEAAAAPLLATVKRVGRAMERSLNADGFFVAINNRVSQSVPHLHVHVVPRRKGDGLKGFFWPRHPYRDDAHVEETRAALAAAIANS